MLYSNLGNENSDAGHIKCSRGPRLARRFSTHDLLVLTKRFTEGNAQLTNAGRETNEHWNTVQSVTKRFSEISEIVTSWNVSRPCRKNFAEN